MTTPRTRRPAKVARAEIIRAAEAEFAQHGIAGARIDRIAASASASKERLYSYFGDKESLFHQVMTGVLTRISLAVEINGEDLPDYTARLVDYFLDHPEDVRMGTWARLEAPTTPLDPDDVRITAHAHKLSEVARAQHEGHVDSHWDPAVLLQLILAAATYWVTDPQDSTASATDQTSHRRERRDNAAETVRRLIQPTN
jgi:AcrR family transcriptional regulator